MLSSSIMCLYDENLINSLSSLNVGNLVSRFKAKFIHNILGNVQIVESHKVNKTNDIIKRYTYRKTE
jgi:hypothetical protein